jgi:hypothetical protein
MRITPLAVLTSLIGIVGLSAMSLAPRSAAARPTDGPCVLTGFAASSDAEARDLRQKLATQPIEELGGIRLDGQRVWALPDGVRPILVVDSTQPLRQGSGEVVLFGQSFRIKQGVGEPVDRYVSTTTMPLLGHTTRTVGLRLHSNACSGDLILAVNRPVWTTTVGMVGIAAAVVFGVIGALLASRRGGRWWRRAVVAAPFGILAGVGEAVVLHEAGSLGPFGHLPFVVAALGVVLTTLLAIRPGALSARATPIVTVLALLAPVLIVGVTVLASDRVPTSDGDLVTPAFARAIVDHAFKQARAGDIAHADDMSKRVIKEYVGATQLTSTVVGVPPGQRTFPVYFAVSAEGTQKGGKPGYFFGRFEQTAAGKPWTMTWASQFTKQEMPTPLLNDNGYLAPAEAFAVDPATLSRTYTDWLARSRKAGKVLDDLLLTDRSSRQFVKYVATDEILDPSARSTISTTYTITPGAVVAAPVPLSDGTAHVIFAANVRIVIHNRTNEVTAACTGLESLDAPGLPMDKRYRQVNFDFVARVEAWVPKKGEPAKVTIEDWNFDAAKQTGVPC